MQQFKEIAMVQQNGIVNVTLEVKDGEIKAISNIPELVARFENGKHKAEW
jgi:alpha-D-ribose 1-methylphosphonate 5-triphosphate diphosphatase PhnM